MVLPILLDPSIVERAKIINAQKLALLDTSKISDEQLEAAQNIVLEAYDERGSNDNAAKSSNMTETVLQKTLAKVAQ